jgi:hypothetical protein
VGIYLLGKNYCCGLVQVQGRVVLQAEAPNEVAVLVQLVSEAAVLVQLVRVRTRKPKLWTSCCAGMASVAVRSSAQILGYTFNESERWR